MRKLFLIIDVYKLQLVGLFLFIYFFLVKLAQKDV